MRQLTVEMMFYIHQKNQMCIVLKNFKKTVLTKLLLKLWTVLAGSCGRKYIWHSTFCASPYKRNKLQCWRR